MGPDDGWQYQDPHAWTPGTPGPPSHVWHHGPPPWVDGPHWSILPSLFPLLMVLWVLYRWYALDRFATSTRRALAAQRDTVRPRWDAAVARHGETAQAYAAFECDPEAALPRPALAAGTPPAPARVVAAIAAAPARATARFVDAFAEATALATDTYPGAELGERFVLAAERAERSWTAAVEAAERVRAARFAPGERALVEQVLALLSLAKSSPHEAERRSAYERSRRRLRDLERRTGWALPRPAAELISTRARGELRAA